MKYDKSDRKYLTFSIDNKTYAVPALSLSGVFANPDVAILAMAPKFVAGIFFNETFNIPIIDLRLLLKRPNPNNLEKTCAIIVSVNFKGQDKLVGFIVDSVSYVSTFLACQIEKLPSIGENEFISGVANTEEQMVFFLDLDKIINEDNLIYFLNEFWILESESKIALANGPEGQSESHYGGGRQ